MNEDIKEKNENGCNSVIKNEENDDLLLIQDSLINSYERDKITFSKNGIIKFLNDLGDQTDWINLFNKDNLILNYKTTVNNFKI